MKFAIIFDMDGVMIDNMDSHIHAWKEFCKRHGFELPEDKMKENIYGRKNSEILKYLFGNELTPNKKEEYSEEKEAIYREVYEEHVKPVKGLIEFLESIKDIPHAVATSAPPENVKLIMKNLDLKKYFDVIVDESMITMGKPNPEIYLKAADRIGIDPKDCIAFEDTFAGINAVKNAGMKVIALATSHTREELDADLIINDFTEIDIDKIKEIMKK